MSPPISLTEALARRRLHALPKRVQERARARVRALPLLRPANDDDHEPLPPAA